MRKVKQLFIETNIYPEYVVMEIPFPEESSVDMMEIIEEVKPFLTEMGIEYTSVSHDPTQISMNVPYESVEDTKEIFSRYGLSQWTLTTGDEDRQAKNDGRLDGGMSQSRFGGNAGWWGGYMPTRLIGEMPGQG